MKHLKVVFILAAVIGLSACQSKVEYGDATEVETVNENFGSTDLQAIYVENARDSAARFRAGCLDIDLPCFAGPCYVTP